MHFLFANNVRVLYNLNLRLSYPNIQLTIPNGSASLHCMKPLFHMPTASCRIEQVFILLFYGRMMPSDELEGTSAEITLSRR